MTPVTRWPWLVSILAIGAILQPDGSPVDAAAPIRRPVVVIELFTSEGCSSCPPADRILSQIVQQPPTDVDVLAIGEHVDYWDRLGWRDRFSSAEFTARQTSYGENAFHRGEIYTPQVVIDGQYARVGSDLEGIRRDIRKAAESDKATVDVALVPAAGGRRLQIAVRAQLPDAYAANGVIDAVVALTEDNLVTDVRAGENRGRTLRHDAVARWMTAVGALRTGERAWQGQTEVPVPADANPANVKVVCFLQERESRRIVGATTARLQR